MAGTEPEPPANGTTPRIVSTDEVLGGDPRIEGRRIGVYDIYARYTEADETPEAIATDFDLSVSEVHAALAYAFENVEEMRTIEARMQNLSEQDDLDRVVPDSGR